jgi:sec-independent protein translocase protein TatB
MFDLGWMELLLIAAVAVLATSPDDIPKLLYEAGRIMRRLRYLRFSLSQQVDQFVRENGMEDIDGSVNLTEEPKMIVKENSADESEL